MAEALPFFVNNPRERSRVLIMAKHKNNYLEGVGKPYATI